MKLGGTVGSVCSQFGITHLASERLLHRVGVLAVGHSKCIKYWGAEEVGTGQTMEVHLGSLFLKLYLVNLRPAKAQPSHSKTRPGMSGWVVLG